MTGAAALALALLTQYPGATNDAGFALDAGVGGQLVDQSSPDASTPAPPGPSHLAVHIAGAKVLPPEVYLDLIASLDARRADEATARAVQEQLTRYLHRTGFDLAEVSAKVTDAGIEVELDEGQVERVLFVGQLSFQQMRFKLALVLPNDVFNRPLLDRQVRELAESMGLRGVRWELIRASEVIHSGPQVTELPSPMALELQGDALVHERRPYEVHIVFPEATARGLGIDVRSGYVNGLELGANWVQPNLFFTGDRLYAAASGGAGLRPRLDTEKLYVHFSRAVVELRYDLFPFFLRVRPNVWSQGELLSRQRPDLQLENYYALKAAAALQLELTVRKAFHFSVGAGFEWRRLFDFTGTAEAPLSPDVVLADRKRPFIRVTHESVIDPTVLRWERRHTLESELRVYLPVLNQPVLAWAELRYQYVRSFGWHDFWVKSQGRVAWGDVTFHDEVSLGEFGRGLFGGQFVPAAMNLQLEFRFSITRDMLKIGLFHDLTVYARHPERGEPRLLAELANAFGPGFHFLANDMFQVDLYVAFGFRAGGQFGVAASVLVQKTF